VRCFISHDTVSHDLVAALTRPALSWLVKGPRPPRVKVPRSGGFGYLAYRYQQARRA
jgi:hypothetical protein